MTNKEPKQTTCQQVQDLLSAYVDQELTAKETAFVAAHLEECTLCRNEYQFMKNLHVAFGGLPEIPLPAEFSTALHSRLLAEVEAPVEQPAAGIESLPQPAVKRKLWQRSWFPRSMAAAIVLCVAFSVVNIIKHDQGTGQQADNVPMVASVEDAPQSAQWGDSTISASGVNPAVDSENDDTAAPEPAQQPVAQEKSKEAVYYSAPDRTTNENESVALASRWLQEPRLEGASPQPEEEKTEALADAQGGAAAPASYGQQVANNVLTVSNSDLTEGQNQLLASLGQYSSAKQLNADAADDSQAVDNALPAADDQEKQAADTDADSGDEAVASVESNNICLEFEISKQDLEAFLVAIPSDFTVVSKVTQENLADLADDDLTTLTIWLQL